MISFMKELPVFIRQRGLYFGFIVQKYKTKTVVCVRYIIIVMARLDVHLVFLVNCATHSFAILNR